MAFDTTTTDTPKNDFNTDAQKAIVAFIGGFPWNVGPTLPADDATIADIDASGIFSDLASREAYLLWVADYKQMVNAAETHIRARKAMRKNPDVGVRYTAQSQADTIGRCVTCAIRMRRLGKRWSAAQRDAAKML
ncbi:hypothetical protein ACOI1H_20215 [Loktanella sp. DJP18]|uniref:hypothetical protein n=1 Tax=Loktanella sp. DJP18 TaxID=3409788 RepID=UPI003BB5007F